MTFAKKFTRIKYRYTLTTDKKPARCSVFV
nr:MAG TPA: hypothetical protein [Caudoviricetes sp.]